MNSIKFEEMEQNLLNQSNDFSTIKDTNPLVNAAIPLFKRVSQMKYFHSQLGILEILASLKKEIETFEDNAEDAGAKYETVRAARYCLCTLLDESAAKYGWANQEWAAKSLLVTFHNETWGGENFFTLLNNIKENPNKNIDLIELMYYCLTLGYMGKYQVLNNGQVAVENIKKDLEKLIKNYKRQDVSVLLHDYKNNGDTGLAQKKIIPLWVILLSMLLVSALLYTYFSWSLAQKTNDVNTRIAALHIKQDKPQQLDKVVLLAPLLKNEIESGLIQIAETPNKTTITILGDELFTSGSDTIQDRFYPVLASVSQALNNVNGQIIVSGYTDNTPIKSIAYPSNWHLSQGRADAVKKILLNYISDESRVRSEGKGDENPVASNDTPANKAKNRRVEITVYIEPGSMALAKTDGVKVVSH